jgi:hypothetical protein
MIMESLQGRPQLEAHPASACRTDDRSAWFRHGFAYAPFARSPATWCGGPGSGGYPACGL